MTAAQPAATRALLDALNHEQAALDALMNRIRGKQWQLFADWYKYLVALYPHGAVTTNPLNVSAADIAAFMKGESNDRIPANPNGPLPDLEKDIASVPAKQAAVDTARNNVLAVKLPEGMELAKKPSDFFWQPSDPTLLLHGDDVVPALRYGGDGLYRADGTLACRTSDRLVRRSPRRRARLRGRRRLRSTRRYFRASVPAPPPAFSTCPPAWTISSPPWCWNPCCCGRTGPPPRGPRSWAGPGALAQVADDAAGCIPRRRRHRREPL